MSEKQVPERPDPVNPLTIGKRSTQVAYGIKQTSEYMANAARYMDSIEAKVAEQAATIKRLTEEHDALRGANEQLGRELANHPWSTVKERDDLIADKNKMRLHIQALISSESQAVTEAGLLRHAIGTARGWVYTECYQKAIEVLDAALSKQAKP